MNADRSSALTSLGAAVVIVAVLQGSLQSSAAAEVVDVRAARHPTHARLVLDWTDAVTVERRVSEASLRLRFDRPFTAGLEPAEIILRTHVAALDLGDDGRSLEVHFRPGFGLQQLRQYQPDLVVIDIAEGAPLGTTAAEDEAVAVRLGSHEGYVRLVFNFAGPVQHRVERIDEALLLTFDRRAIVDTAALGHQLGSYLAEFASLDGPRSGMRLHLRPDVRADVFGLNDDLVVIDLHQRAAEQVTKDETTGSRPSLHQAAAKPAVGAPEPPSAEARPVYEVATAPEHPLVGQTTTKAVATESSQAAAERGGLPDAVWPELSADLTKRGIELSVTFPSATSAAVFSRSDHVWMIFDSPASAAWRAPELDPVIGQHLGDVEVIGGEPETPGMPGWTVLRVRSDHHLEPEVTREGMTWKILLVPDARAPDIVPIERGSDPPDLRLFAEGSRATLLVRDPVIGDDLLVWPLARSGLGAHAREFVDIALLPTAQGLVLRPLSDDVVAQVVASGLLVASNGGMHLSDLRPVDVDEDASAPVPARGGGVHRAEQRSGGSVVAQAATSREFEAVAETATANAATADDTVSGPRSAPGFAGEPFSPRGASFRSAARVHDFSAADGGTARRDPAREDTVPRAPADPDDTSDVVRSSVGGEEGRPPPVPARPGLSVSAGGRSATARPWPVAAPS